MAASPAPPLFSHFLVPTQETDVSEIRGNVSDHEKQLSLRVFKYFVSTQDKSYGADIGQRLKLVETNVWGREGGAAYGETVFEIVVRRGKYPSLTPPLPVISPSDPPKICATYSGPYMVPVQLILLTRTCFATLLNHSP